MRLLLVEDDEILGDGLKAGLAMEGYAVDWITDGRQAELVLATHTYQLIVLDLNLPGASGLEILGNLRRRKDETPVLVLTARDTVADRVAGLDSGADDFVVKPFDLSEVCARLRALSRRQAGRGAPLLEHRGIVLDPAAHTVACNGQRVDLALKEFAILHFLLSHIGKVVSRAQIEQALYAWDSEVESNTIEVHIHHLRKKLDQRFIRTVRGVGYIIDEH
ncbi:MAG: response regulator [Methylococcales bacterium]|nr:response regulator [Methylococcales bacterium]